MQGLSSCRSTGAGSSRSGEASSLSAGATSVDAVQARTSTMSSSTSLRPPAKRAREDTPQEASSSALLDGDVECTGERSREERDAELRRDAVDVDGGDD